MNPTHSRNLSQPEKMPAFITSVSSPELIPPPLSPAISQKTSTNVSSGKKLKNIIADTIFSLKINKINEYLSKKYQVTPIPDDTEVSLYNLDENTENENSRHDTKMYENSGKEAVSEFYSNYKNVTKSVSPFLYKRKSAAFEYIKELEKNRMLPKPLGIVKWKGPPHELDLKYFFISSRM